MKKLNDVESLLRRKIKELSIPLEYFYEFSTGEKILEHIEELEKVNLANTKCAHA